MFKKNSMKDRLCISKGKKGNITLHKVKKNHYYLNIQL